MERGKKRHSVTLVGAGRLASALATLLPKAGFAVDEIVTRHPLKVKGAEKQILRKSGGRLTTAEDATWSSEVVWLAVSDGAIASCAGAIAKLTKWEGKIVLHSSGALSSDVLSALRRKGAYVASAHPMMSFVAGEPPSLSGVVWTLEGDPRAVSSARSMVKALGGTALKIDKKSKPLYHAFGAFLSPLLVVHLETAMQLALDAGIPRTELASLMRPIVERTLNNLFANVKHKKGSGRAFSGPLIRGDVETIEGHLQALKKMPTALGLYVALISAALQSELPVKNRSEIGKAIGRFLRQ